MYNEIILYSLMPLLVVLAVAGIWNNWIIIGKDGYLLRPHPSFMRWAQIGIANVFRVATLRPIVKFRNLPEYNN